MDSKNTHSWVIGIKITPMRRDEASAFIGFTLLTRSRVAAAIALLGLAWSRRSTLVLVVPILGAP